MTRLKKLTDAWLRKHGACVAAREQIHKQYPAGFPLEESAVRAIMYQPWNVDMGAWLLEEGLPQPDRFRIQGALFEVVWALVTAYVYSTKLNRKRYLDRLQEIHDRVITGARITTVDQNELDTILRACLPGSGYSFYAWEMTRTRPVDDVGGLLATMISDIFGDSAEGYVRALRVYRGEP